jgi:endonuclease YncB( thermonuclease family)
MVRFVRIKKNNHLSKSQKMNSLTISSAKRLPVFSLDGLSLHAFCSEVYDVDSCTICVDLFGKICKFKIRITGIDGCELRSRDADEKRMARMARREARALLLGQFAVIHCNKPDKYGRTLARITLADGRDFAEVVLAEKLCVRYDGGRKADAATWKMLDIERHRRMRPPHHT